MTPDTTHGQDTTSPVEADLILDEHTAILFHPLGDLGQATGFDVEGGLKILVATLARIGPRYKNLWLIFEEYHSPAYWYSHCCWTASVLGIFADIGAAESLFGADDEVFGPVHGVGAVHADPNPMAL
ncbi:hypothetical protein BGZ96_009211 [Linnemannia gamsii]|uniref:Uncharacterized protein n=1 Tax=Linnemannia gamsii TaxID=64522 RepID=A0ABQ7JWN2_9FUNG|nr:hypothetical protein BGZ96_009211 [Linnemannia gamsii]